MTPTWRKGMAMVAVMMILIGIGWVMLFSTSGAMDLGGEAGRTMFRYLARQMVATGLGAAAILFIIRRPLAEMEEWAMVAVEKIVTPEWLAELQAMAEKATEGPWLASKHIGDGGR